MKLCQDIVYSSAGDLVINPIGGVFPNRNWIGSEPILLLYTIKIDHEHWPPETFELL